MDKEASSGTELSFSWTFCRKNWTILATYSSPLPDSHGVPGSQPYPNNELLSSPLGEIGLLFWTSENIGGRGRAVLGESRSSRSLRRTFCFRAASHLKNILPCLDVVLDNLFQVYEQGFGPDDLQRPLSTSTSLWFCLQKSLERRYGVFKRVKLKPHRKRCAGNSGRTCQEVLVEGKGSLSSGEL